MSSRAMDGHAMCAMCGADGEEHGTGWGGTACVRCTRCGATTGAHVNLESAWRAWDRGAVHGGDRKLQAAKRK